LPAGSLRIRVCLGKSDSNSTPSTISEEAVKMQPVAGTKHHELFVDDRCGGDFYTANDKLMDENLTTKNRYKNGLTGVSQKSIENLLSSKESDL